MTIITGVNTRPSMSKGDAINLREYLSRVVSNEYPTPTIISCDTSVFIGPGPQSITNPGGKWVDGVTVLHFRCDTLAGAQGLLARTGARSVSTDPPQGPLPDGEIYRTVLAVWHALYFKIKYEEFKIKYEEITS